MSLDKVFRDTPSASAAWEMPRPSGSRYCRLRIPPGWTGGRVRSRIAALLSVIIQVVDLESIALFETKDHSPVPRHFHRPEFSPLPFEGMEVSPRVAHILYLVCRVEPIKNIGELPRMARLDTFLASVVEKIFKPLVRKADNHSKTVTE